MNLLLNNRLIRSLIGVYNRYDPFIFWATLSSILLAFGMSLFVYLNMTRLPEMLPIFYSLPWGEEQLGTIIQFSVLPFSIILILFLNLIISWHLHNSQIPVKRVIAAFTIFNSLLLIITGFKIIQVFI